MDRIDLEDDDGDGDRRRYDDFILPSATAINPPDNRRSHKVALTVMLLCVMLPGLRLHRFFVVVVVVVVVAVVVFITVIQPRQSTGHYVLVVRYFRTRHSSS